MRKFEVNKRADSSKNKDSSLLNRVLNKMLYRIMLGAGLGALVGLLYWEYIGCNGGSCPLTSNPYKTVIIFTIMGGFMAKK